MARSAKTTTKATATPSRSAARSTKADGVKPNATQPQPVKGKTARAARDLQAVPKLASGRGKAAAALVTPATPTRVPPPSKGELRAQIVTLETANATLKVKSREANRAAKLAGRRITELEGQVAQLEAAATKMLDRVDVPKDVKPARRGKLPGRARTIDPGDAVPPGVAVQQPQPLDEEAVAARDALEHFPIGLNRKHFQRRGAV